MKNRINRLILVFLASMLFASCNFLSIEDYFSDELHLDSVFLYRRYLEAYLWDIPVSFPDEGTDVLRNGRTPGPLATDEAITARDAAWDIPGSLFVTGQISASNLGSLNQWGDMYRIIRRCNIFLSRSIEAVNSGQITMTQQQLYNSYARFFRAYAYYRIFMDFGPPILLDDEVVSNNESMDFYNRPRATFDEAMEYICEELEIAARLLPRDQPIQLLGRPTRGAAWGLIARLRLIHASPLYNDGEWARFYFGQWRRSSDDAFYVYQGTPIEERWAIAAAAAKRVIDTRLYELYTTPVNEMIASQIPFPPVPPGVISESEDPDYYKEWPAGSQGIDHLRSFANIFNGEEVLQQLAREYVWGRNSGGLTGGVSSCFPYTSGGENNLAVTQKMVDAFYMFDGSCPLQGGSTHYPYTASGTTSATQIFSGYTLNSETSNRFANREMRFYASVGFHNRHWPQRSITAGMPPRDITYDRNGNNGSQSHASNYPATGYIVTKYVNDADALGRSGVEGARIMPKTFGIIRYSEILLSYVEALNNLTQSWNIELDGNTQTYTRDEEEMREAFRQVRHRAGLPAPSPTDLLSVTRMQELIERERMIEFLYENRRYYDVRRWAKYEDTEYASILGLNTQGSDDSFFQMAVPPVPMARNRVVHRRMIYLPLPLDEVRKLPLLDQNPGWER